MTAKMKTTLKIDTKALDQVEKLARRYKLSQDQIIEFAIEYLINNHPDLASLDESGTGHGQHEADERREITQGEIYWVRLEDPQGASGSIIHPHVVVQNDVLNRRRIKTTVVCALTTNLKRAAAPGNVLLETGEANLPKQSVVEVSKISTAKKAEIGDYIGSLSPQRLSQIMAGMAFLQKSTAR